ncbi:hypothetical protein ACH5RR_017449, partial [Cinchona calisaya]
KHFSTSLRNKVQKNCDNMAVGFHITAAILMLAFAIVYASDPSPLQDFCVAIGDADAN